VVLVAINTETLLPNRSLGLDAALLTCHVKSWRNKMSIDVTTEHLLAQVKLLEDGDDQNFSMKTWIDWIETTSCRTTHCLYGGAALLAGQTFDQISEGVPNGWDVGENTFLWLRLFYMQGLTARHAVTIARSIKDRRFNLSEADLTRADLTKAHLIKANLSSASLVGADLTEATLIGADLREANLFEAILYEADLAGVNLAGANLRESNLTKVELFNASLIGADLSGATLFKSDLTQADLTEVNLTGTNLSWANLTGANLSKVNLTRANLTGANLTGANLTGADLSEADLTGSIGLPPNL
jgi:uncharacterized protein YjbI with pentapeptide repeats